MLSLNEADRLPATLEQSHHFAQWLIFDTGSTDNSIQIARDAGAEVVEHPWEGFSLTRIHQFQQAREEWILWLDADEVIPDALIEELYALFDPSSPPPKHRAYRLNRMIYFEEKWIKHGDWFPDWNARLFHRDSWSMEERAVHESLEIDGSIGELHTPLEHYSFRSWEDKEQRSVKYAQLWAEMQRQKGKKASPLSPITRGIWKFLRGYLLKGGWMDGRIGLKVAHSNARETHQKYTLLRQLHKQ